MSRKIVPKNVIIFEIGERIRQVREFYNLSQKTLAENLGLNKRSASISEWEGGIKELGITFLSKLSKIFKEIDIHWLITGEGSMLRTKEESDRLSSTPIAELVHIVRMLEKDDRLRTTILHLIECKKDFDRAIEQLRSYFGVETEFWFKKNGKNGGEK